MIQSHQDHSTFRLSPLAMWLSVAILGGCALGLAGGMARGLPVEHALSAAFQSGIAWSLATALGLVALRLLTSGSVAQLGMGVLAASTVRMLAGLALGLVVYFGLRVGPGGAGAAFWFTLLGCGLATLVVEACWAVSKLRTLDAGASPAPSVIARSRGTGS